MDGRKRIIIAALCVYDNGFEICLKNHNNIMGARGKLDISRVRMYFIIQKKKNKNCTWWKLFSICRYRVTYCFCKHMYKKVHNRARWFKRFDYIKLCGTGKFYWQHMGEDDEYSNNYSTILYEKNLNTDGAKCTSRRRSGLTLSTGRFF